MVKKILIIVFLVVAIVIMALPVGVGMVFATEAGPLPPQYYSYFSGLPYGYAVFTPILVAICSCVALILSIVALFVSKRRLNEAISAFCIIALLLSPWHYVFKPSTINVWNILVSALLLFVSAISFIPNKKISKR